MSIIDRVAPQVRNWPDAKHAYFAHLLSSWYGWGDGTGFIMPSDTWRSIIQARVLKAVKTTERNRP